MTKQEFLAQLRKGLSGLPEEDIYERLTFYSEMIEDRMEEGCPEEDAVQALGSVDELAAQTVADTPLSKLVKEKITPKRKLKAWEIVLLVLGAPVWLPLLLSALAVVLAVCVVLWSVLLVFWAVFAAVAVSALACIAAGIIFTLKGRLMLGLAALAAGLVCAGIAVFWFFACKLATKGIVALTKKCALGTKRRFLKKEDAQ